LRLGLDPATEGPPRPRPARRGLRSAHPLFGAAGAAAHLAASADRQALLAGREPRAAGGDGGAAAPDDRSPGAADRAAAVPGRDPSAQQLSVRAAIRRAALSPDAGRLSVPAR